MATIPETRPAGKPRTFEPVTGSFVWKTPWDGSTGRLVISTKTGAASYVVSAMRSGSGSPHFGGLLLGYELVNEGSGEIYHVAVEPWGWDCDCWDGLIRQQHAPTPECRGCKHVTALQAALPGKQAA
jgi:hypothetical protein